MKPSSAEQKVGFGLLDTEFFKWIGENSRR